MFPLRLALHLAQGLPSSLNCTSPQFASASYASQILTPYPGLYTVPARPTFTKLAASLKTEN